jgi:hypothetical protein
MEQGQSYFQNLSLQQLVSCDDENGGCNGGNLYYTMQYVVVAAGATRLAD